MSRLDRLRETADETLAGLEAGPGLRNRILLKARTPVRRTWRRYAAAAAALAVLLAVGLPLLLGNGRVDVRPEDGPLITSMTAGDGSVANERADLSGGRSKLTVVQDNAANPQGIWAEGAGSFPMVAFDGRYYRRLTGGSLSEGSLGARVATITEFTREPALSGGGALSNAVPVGTEIFAVNGMGGTLVACHADGELQVFQRVSYNGYALLGGEGLADVLQLRGRIVRMSLSGAGLAEGAEAERLFGILANSAVYESAGSVSASQVLLIELDNGAVVQMVVRNDRLGGCGVWSCPDFIDAFDQLR